MKTILREGSGEKIPSEGVQAIVHYTGRFTDGTVFDSSKKRGIPFQFSLNKRQVIFGWDACVSTMKKNEICVVTCKSSYAYGDRGIGPIPPKSTLVFEIELIDWIPDDGSNSTLFSEMLTKIWFYVLIAFVVGGYYVYAKGYYL